MQPESEESNEEQANCTRRQALRAGGAALTAGVAGSSAGCLSLLPPVGQQIRYGRVDVPAPTNEQPVYRKWMPADSAAPDLEHTDGFSDTNWIYVTPGNLGRAQLGGEFRIGIDVVQSSLSYFGTPLDAHDHLVGLGSLGSVVESNVDSERTESTLRSSGFERVDSYHEYELFDRTTVPQTIAVSGDAVIQTRGEKRQAKAETLIDAGDGRIDRYHETDQTFAAFSEWLGTYPTVMDGFPPNIVETDADATAMVYTFDEEAAYFVYKHQFPGGETPTRGEIKRRLSDELTRPMQAWSVDIEIDDPQVSIQMRVEQEQFGSDFSAETVPFVTWSIDETGEAVTVRHEAGESVPVEKLEIEPSDALRDRPAAGETLEPGDTLVFERESLAIDRGEDAYRDIDIVYHFSNQSSAMLFSYDPDANDTTT
jgi:hypothetical protein